ncbi:hypothetical protein TYRP_003068 [Tyrophagus putrescentiae]|nr:hypothetical protein TYRP_003068 [Tyrophagus putrescentiae]
MVAEALEGTRCSEELELASTVVEGLETSSQQAGGFRLQRRPPLRREEVVVVEEEGQGLLGPAQLKVEAGQLGADEACRADVADVLVGAHRQLGDLQVVGEKVGAAAQGALQPLLGAH